MKLCTMRFSYSGDDKPVLLRSDPRVIGEDSNGPIHAEPYNALEEHDGRLILEVDRAAWPLVIAEAPVTMGALGLSANLVMDANWKRSDGVWAVIWPLLRAASANVKLNLVWEFVNSDEYELESNELPSAKLSVPTSYLSSLLSVYPELARMGAPIADARGLQAFLSKHVVDGVEMHPLFGVVVAVAAYVEEQWAKLHAEEEA